MGRVTEPGVHTIRENEKSLRIRDWPLSVCYFQNRQGGERIIIIKKEGWNQTNT